MRYSARFNALLGALFSTILVTSPGAAEDGRNVVPSVRLIKADEPRTRQTRQFFGRIEARETVELSFEVSGHMNVVNATEGARVPKGAVLAALDPVPFERAVRRAELSLDQAERDLQRARTLAQSNVASQVRAQDAETARDLAKVALREARDALSDTQIVAPFDGLVAQRLTPNFTNVPQGQPILRLHDMSEVQVSFELPERLLARAVAIEGITFETRLPGFEDPVPLRYVEFHAETGRIGQSYTVSLAFPKIESPFLVPGGTVTVTASVPVTRDGIELPVSALLSGADRSASVMVFDTTGNDRAKVRRHPVEVQSETGTSFVVTGIDPGTEIVAVGGHLLTDGQTVRRYIGLTVEED
ncbi:efflux RND transporter periplasmic adaptor subunit [Thalassococcus sp. S3]|uniref:efflux RND transporter periplasmic adaptor subunit n=1 Tax=Thalassococcus sp. S3 TaxID=2017482 RepID=UPI0010248364|nr:efflux RND transporter periplasmic adaptor subunit [Thalassococcus sp. S3]QBF30982.1 efflux transporter periplasmic adaptor subunit [Thalassococcus sp. S3]